MQRTEVGATEGIAWELLLKLVTIKQAQNEPQSLHALPSFLKGADRQGRSLESTQQIVQAEEGALQPPGMHMLYKALSCRTTAFEACTGPCLQTHYAMALRSCTGSLQSSHCATAFMTCPGCLPLSLPC